MELHDFTTEELNLCVRVADCLADYANRDTVDGHVLAAAAEIFRSALRARTLHDPLPGQTSFVE